MAYTTSTGNRYGNSKKYFHRRYGSHAFPEHPEFSAYCYDYWKCDIVLNGSSEDMKDANFILALTGQEALSYAQYVDRAVFLNAASRARDGFMGAVFAKAPIIQYDRNGGNSISDAKANDTIQEGMRYIDRYIDGNSMTFIRSVFKEVLDLGRCGILVDRPVEGTPASENVPYLLCYPASSIINWNFVSKGRNNYKLNFVVICLEKTRMRIDGCDSVREYTILELDDEGYYKKTVKEESFDKNTSQDKGIIDDLKDKFSSKTDKLRTISEVYPTQNGQKMTEIPFFFINVHDLSPKISKPPLLDVVDMNIAHFRNSADMERGLHFTALPTPWIAGFNVDTDFTIGSEKAWVTDAVDAKAGFLEFQGQGLDALGNALEKKELLMAMLSSKLLETQRGKESSETQKIRRLGEDSILANIALNVELGLNKAFHFAGEWDGDKNASKNFSIVLNKQYTVTVVKSDVVATMLNAVMKGFISMETWLSYLRSQDLLSTHVSDKKESDAIVKGLEMLKKVKNVVDPVQPKVGNPTNKNNPGNPSKSPNDTGVDKGDE